MLVGLGEVLVDVFGEVRCPGGAPANVACTVAALGLPAAVVSRLGADADGRLLQDWLQQAGVETMGLGVDPEHPTGTAMVQACAGGGTRFELAQEVAWDFLQADAASRAVVQQARVLVFGTLAQRQPASRKALRTLVESVSAGCLRVCDLNLRPPWFDQEVVFWSLRHCDLLRLNSMELGVLAGILGASGAEHELMELVAREFALRRMVVTRGGEGVAWFEDGKISHRPALPAVIVDGTGAGDGFTAGLCAALMLERPWSQSLDWGLRVAARVVAHQGAVAPLPPEWRGLPPGLPVGEGA